MRAIRIASRSSKLALTQTHYIRDALLTISPDLDISVLEISTHGDRDRSDFLYKSQVQGLFTSEVENALLDGRADIAVHSLKDLPTSGSPELTVGAVPTRQDVSDVLVCLQSVTGLSDLPQGAKMGTSSLRRIAQLKHARPDLDCVPLRGNVETRVSKVQSGDIDVAVMACAGLNRLGMADRIAAVLAPDQFLPAPGQGALAVQIRAADTELAPLIARLNDTEAQATANAERMVLAAMHGGCSIPLGVHARLQDRSLTIEAMISDVEGKTYIRRSRNCDLDQAQACTTDLAQEMLDAGGQQILDQIRNSS
jgi:hydroxymethylbilane synthase